MNDLRQIMMGGDDGDDDNDSHVKVSHQSADRSPTGTRLALRWTTVECSHVGKFLSPLQAEEFLLL